MKNPFRHRHRWTFDEVRVVRKGPGYEQAYAFFWCRCGELKKVFA